jgi:TatD DNase family protein
MEFRYFDAHCHPQFGEYDADRDVILGEMENQSVGGLVVGCDFDSSQKAAALADSRDFLYAAVGLHPNHAVNEIFNEQRFCALLKNPKVVAIGECGLDYYRMEDATEEAKKAQQDLFEKHIALAIETKKPLIIHARPTKGSMDAYEDALEILERAKREYGDALRGDFHFFVGDADTLHRVLTIDFHVSFTAVITFARDYDEVIRAAPLNRILAETDSPYVAPASRRGKRNDPLAVIDVVRMLAEVRGESEEMLREATVQNTLRFVAI